MTYTGSPKKYHSTVNGVLSWAQSELEHVGRIASVEDPDIQYSYALSTVNGMFHLRNALYELIKDDEYKVSKADLQKQYDAVIRVIKHIIKDYNINIDTIKKFNTRNTIGNLSNFKSKRVTRNRVTRKNR